MMFHMRQKKCSFYEIINMLKIEEVGRLNFLGPIIDKKI